MATRLMTVLRVFLEAPEAISLQDCGLQTLIFNTLTEVAFATAGVFLVLIAASVAGTMSQTGLFVSLELITPD
ncbi:hypothetical protein, partial [Klebsiella pneumoniae]|uniref:hypothetical protein n=1 Tax=Klebsiella pneumoniae TaxID=573 RepID=UPI003EE30B24